MEKQNMPVLNVQDLSISFDMYDKGMNKRKLEMVHQLSVEVSAGEIVAVAGSSGSGKSLLAHAVLGILPGNALVEGKMEFCGNELNQKLQQKLRGNELAFIPQSVGYLDPLMKVGKQVRGISGTFQKQEEIFERYQLEKKTANLYPYELSGGMARRVLIASAVMGEPKLIIADEPTPGLSEEMAKETLLHFRELANQGCGVLLITHDIDLAFQIADKIAIFYAGTTMEVAPVEDFHAGKDALRHPYSKALLEALPQNEFRGIAGFQPYAGELPGGCLFAARCPQRTEECSGNIKMRTLRGGKVRCIHGT